MRLRMPRQITDYAISIGVMAAFLTSALAVCAAPVVIGAALFR